MKKLIFALLLALVTATPSNAAKPKDEVGIKPKQKSALVVQAQKKLKIRKKKFNKLETKVIRFFVSPSLPKQGESVVIFAQVATRFQNSDIFLEGEFDGNPVALEKTASELWAYDAGKFLEIGEHVFTANVYIRDTAQANEIKDAILVLDATIADLNEQIENEPVGPGRDVVFTKRF